MSSLNLPNHHVAIVSEAYPPALQAFPRHPLHCHHPKGSIRAASPARHPLHSHRPKRLRSVPASPPGGPQAPECLRAAPPHPVHRPESITPNRTRLSPGGARHPVHRPYPSVGSVSWRVPLNQVHEQPGHPNTSRRLSPHPRHRPHPKRGTASRGVPLNHVHEQPGRRIDSRNRPGPNKDGAERRLVRFPKQTEHVVVSPGQ